MVYNLAVEMTNHSLKTWLILTPGLLLSIACASIHSDTLVEDIPIPKITLPGTKWCGPGNSSSNPEDVGPFYDTDKCCRSHDKCKDFIPSGETRFNLTNTEPFTRLSCECDEEFRTCLTDVGSFLSKKLRNLYFHKLQEKCFKLDYPIIGCSKCARLHFFWKRCIEYELNTTAPKEYQWFDLPFDAQQSC